jgi:hypothetical protein
VESATAARRRRGVASLSQAFVDRFDALAARLRLDRFELSCLVVLSGVSLAVLMPLLSRLRPLSGSDGLYPADQMQYFAWIRDAGDHLLIGNRFDLVPSQRVFLHPLFLVSGLLHDAGLSVPLSYLAWKPVAVGVTYVGSLLYVRRLLSRRGQRHAALVIVLFAVMPAAAAVAWTGWGGNPRQYTFDFISGEMWSGQYLWGYLFTAIAVFLMPLILLAVEAWRRKPSARLLWLASAGVLLVSWLQPWQGITLALIVFSATVWAWWRDGARPPAALLVFGVATVLPLAYYAALSHFDPSWHRASLANAAGAQPTWHWPWWAIVLTVAPLAAPAALAYRLPASSWQERAVRIWPLAALAVYLQPLGTFPYHSFQGLALPLGILAVQGVASVRPMLRGTSIAAALAVLTVPGFAHKLEVAASNVHLGADPYFIFPDEQRALAALSHDRRPGGVLAPLYSGFFIPYTTGRQVYVGALSWSPDFMPRRAAADALFEGRLRGAAARAFVRSTHARFLFADCRKLTDLTSELGSLLEQAERFGCATVYVLRYRPDMRKRGGLPDQ